MFRAAACASWTNPSWAGLELCFSSLSSLASVYHSRCVCFRYCNRRGNKMETPDPVTMKSWAQDSRSRERHACRGRGGRFILLTIATWALSSADSELSRWHSPQLQPRVSPPTVPSYSATLALLFFSSVLRPRMNRTPLSSLAAGYATAWPLIRSRSVPAVKAFFSLPAPFETLVVRAGRPVWS